MSDYQTAQKKEDKKTVSPQSASNAAHKSAEQAGFPCLNCNAEIPQGALFCPECGVDLSTPAFCPNCGAKTYPGADICQECGFWLLEGKCKFCYAVLSPEASHCHECGNHKDGIQCPHCGILSIFDFCTSCRKPLTEGARAAVELAKKDPDAKAVLDAIDETARLDAQLAKLEELLTSPPPEFFDVDEPVVAPVKKIIKPSKRERFSQEQLDAILETEKRLDSAKGRQDDIKNREEIIKQQEDELRARDEQEEQDRKEREEKEQKDLIEQKQKDKQAKIDQWNAEDKARQDAIDDLKKQKAAAAAAAQAALVALSNKTFDNQQDARRFYNVLRPISSAGWRCNAYGVTHSGPNECAAPWQGGHWV